MNSQIKTNSINIGTRILFVVFESIFVSIFFKLKIYYNILDFCFIAIVEIFHRYLIKKLNSKKNSELKNFFVFLFQKI